jgi:ERCC4-type nuclease
MVRYTQIAVCPSIHIVTDTREQLPMWKGKECRRIKLDVGDYTTEKLHGKFHVERKSPQDLYGTLAGGHVRFRNELIRAKVTGVKLCIFIETTRIKFLNLNFTGGKYRKLKGETLLRIVDTMEKKYGVEVIWCKNRKDCKENILKRFKREQKLLTV